MLSFISCAPRHVVPPSSVMNPRTSTPLVVNVGATPPGHLVPLNQVCVPVPPLVNSSKKLYARLAGVLLIVHVRAPVAVLMKYVPVVQSIADADTDTILVQAPPFISKAKAGEA